MQISRGRLALVIENFKAYVLALPEIPNGGRPDRGEMDKTSAPPSVFMDPWPFLTD